MQTTNSRNDSSDTSQRTSPVKPQNAQQIKSSGSDSNLISSPDNHRNRKKKRRSKQADRASPRSPMSEKHTSREFDLEPQVDQLQEELKRVKEQLSELEEQKNQAQQETEEVRRKMQQVVEFSDSEKARLEGLCEGSQDRDQSRQVEFEALQRQHAMDASALASAMDEIQRLKKQLEETTESEAAESAHEEIQSLRNELNETLDLVEKMKCQLADAKESESRAFEAVSEIQTRPEAAKKSVVAYSGLASELEQSKAQVSRLEKLVSQLQADELNEEIDSLKFEVGELESALEASEIRYQEECIKSTLQIGSAYDAVDRAESEASIKEAKSEEELKKANDLIEELKSDLASYQTSVQEISLEKEMTSMKLGYLTEEANKSRLTAVRVSDQLGAAQVANGELRDELRKMKVQTEQWRKAAEAAAAMISPAGDGDVLDRTASMKMDSPLLESLDEDSVKRRNAKMLKKIGGLWKKGQKQSKWRKFSAKI